MAKTKLEELVVELSVENKALVSQLKASQEDTNKSMKAMAKSIEGFAKESNSNISTFQRIFETAVGFVGGQAVMAAFGRAKDVALGFFNTMITDGVAAAQVQEDAINDLNSALARTGQFSLQASQDLQAYASALQANSKFGDETILSTMSLIQSLGNLERDGLKGATQATLDMAAALNIDLKAAATLVGKAAAGEVSSFTRYGVAIQKGKDAAETFSNTLEALNSKFGGAAAAQIKTYSGAVTQTKNTFGDFQEEIGFVFTQNTALIEVIGELNSIFSELGGEVKDNRSSLQALVADGIIIAAEALPLLADGVGIVVDAYGWWKMATNELIMLNAKLSFASQERLAYLEEESEKEVKLHLDRKAKMDEVSERAIKMKDRIVEAAEKGSAAQEEMNKMYEAQSEAAKRAAEAASALTEEQKKQADEGKKLAEELILAIEEDNELRNELLAQRLQTEQEMLDQARANNLISEKQHAAALIEIRDKLDADKRKRELAKLKFESDIQKSRVDILSASANLVTAISGRESKVAFFMSKAAAIAQSIIATRVASAMALANPPGPPATIPLAANIKLAGNINTAAIAATAIQGFNAGTDSVPGIGFQDTVPAMLTPGERVVPKETNKDLTRFLQNIQSGGQEVTVHHTFGFKDLDGFVEVLESKIVERQSIGVSLLRSA